MRSLSVALQAHEDGAFDLRADAVHVDNSAWVYYRDDAIDVDIPFLHRDLDDLSEIAGLREKQENTATTISAEWLTPTGLLCGEVEHMYHPHGIGERAIEGGPGRHRMCSGVLKQTTAKEVGILLREVSDFVDEALDRKNIEGYLDAAPGSPGGTAIDRHIGDPEILCWIGLIESAPELKGLCLFRVTLADDGGIGDAVGPRNKVSLLIDAGAKAVHAGGAVAIVHEVVLTGPDELDGVLDATGDLENLMIKRYSEAAAKASTHEGDMDSDSALGDAEDFGGRLLGPCAGLGRGPYLATAVLEPDGDVHGLHRDVGEERKLVDALDALSGGHGIGVEVRIGGAPVFLRVETCT